MGQPVVYYGVHDYTIYQYPQVYMYYMLVQDQDTLASHVGNIPRLPVTDCYLLSGNWTN